MTTEKRMPVLIVEMDPSKPALEKVHVYIEGHKERIRGIGYQEMITLETLLEKVCEQAMVIVEGMKSITANV